MRYGLQDLECCESGRIAGALPLGRRFFRILSCTPGAPAVPLSTLGIAALLWCLVCQTVSLLLVELVRMRGGGLQPNGVIDPARPVGGSHHFLTGGLHIR